MPRGTRREPPTEIDAALHTWMIGDKPRRWCQVDLPFAAIRRIAKIEAYSDETRDGFQRTQTPRYKRHLAKEITSGNFTPTPWVLAVLPDVRNRMKTYATEDGRERVLIKLPAGEKLGCIDGGGRWGALDILHGRAVASNDVDAIETIESTVIPLIIQLDPEHLLRDFRNLQKGTPMDRNVTRSMEQAEDADPAARLADQVVHMLARDRNSFLYGQVKFDSAGRGVVNYSTAIAKKSSDLATSVTAGAMIALHAEKDAAWLVGVYNDLWAALQGPDGVRPFLRRGRLMCPALEGGKSGPTLFLVAVANVVAWARQHGEDDVLERAVEVLEATMDQAHLTSGWSAADKRVFVGAFVRRLFEDYEGDVVDGVPLGLIRLLSASAFKVDPKLVPKDDGVIPGLDTVMERASPARTSPRPAAQPPG